MNTPIQWNEADLLALIANQTKESIDLEYKASAALGQSDKQKDELSKDVSAFANSAGGTIVYGIAEVDNYPKRIDGGYDPQVISKEWLEQVINSRIQRRIDGIRINQVELTTTNPGWVAYVVVIPQSDRAPHQAADKRFYKRFNFQSIPMEEYEIRDVAQRSQAPDLELEFVILEEGRELCFAGGETFSQPIQVAIRIKNVSPTPAEYAVVNLLFDGRLQLTPPKEAQRSTLKTSVAAPEGTTPTDHFCVIWGIPAKIPIFGHIPFTLTPTPFQIHVPSGADEYIIAWDVQSPRMTRKMGVLRLKTDGATCELVEVDTSQP